MGLLNLLAILVALLRLALALPLYSLAALFIWAGIALGVMALLIRGPR